MTALLAGIKVLDLTNVLAGPFGGYQLALLGADVLKVETPSGGDLARRLGADVELSEQDLGVSFLAQNSAKRSIAIDLKTDAGAAIFRRLVAEYDVLIENFRPGVMGRLGFDWEALRRINPSLVYCAISGFGQSGPMRDRPAYDQIVQGLSGLMSVTGTLASGPTRVGAPICDSLGGMVAAFGIASALVRRAATGEGAFLDVSMLDAAITAMGWVASDQLIAGTDPEPMGNDNRTAAPSGTFATARGQLNIAANKQEQFEALCRVLELESLLVDDRFATREARRRHRRELTVALEERLTTRPADEWDAILRTANVPAAPIATVREALESDQIRSRGIVGHVENPADGPDLLRVLGSPVQVDGEAQLPAFRPPRLGEHTAAVLGGLGYSDDEIDAFHEQGVVTWPTLQPTGGRPR